METCGGQEKKGEERTFIHNKLLFINVGPIAIAFTTVSNIFVYALKWTCSAYTHLDSLRKPVHFFKIVTPKTNNGGILLTRLQPQLGLASTTRSPGSNIHNASSIL